MAQPVTPNTLFTVSLEAQAWNAVLGMMAEAPFKIAQPLIQAISQQLQQQAPQQQAPEATVEKPAINGFDPKPVPMAE